MKQLIFILLFISVLQSAKAQDAGSFNFSFNHMALSVKDLAKSAAFYKNVLRLPEITNRTKMEGIRWFALSDGRELHLISTVAGEIKINKAVHLALACPAFDSFVQHLTDNKILYSDWPGAANTVFIRADGIKQIYLQDPDGYWIEVNTAGK